MEIKVKDERFELRLPSVLLSKAQEKAQEMGFSLASILRRLLEKWLKGEIGLD